MFRWSSVFISNYFKEAQNRTESGLEKLQHIITEILTKTHRDICSSSPENVQTIELLRRITEIALSSATAAHNVLLLSVQKQKKSRRAQERKLAEIFSLSINVVSGRVCQVFGQLFEFVST